MQLSYTRIWCANPVFLYALILKKVAQCHGFTENILQLVTCLKMMKNILINFYAFDITNFSMELAFTIFMFLKKKYNLLVNRKIYLYVLILTKKY